MKKIPILPMSVQKIDYRKLLPLQGSVRWLSTEGSARLKASFESEGFCLPFFVWKKGENFFILDGHGREKLLEKEGATFVNELGEETCEVPCLIIEAEDEASARRKILLINSQYQQWTNNKEDINSFLHKIDLDWLNKAVNIPQITLPDIKLPTFTLPNKQDGEAFDNSESIYEIKENPLFERGINEYDIPMLLSEFSDIPDDIETWCGAETKAKYYLFLQGHNTKNLVTKNSILSFYSWDDHFDGIWTKLLQYTENIGEADYYAVVSPNYSITGEDPIAFQIWQIYRTRYITRFWQEAGIKVLPDVIWSNKKSFEFCFLGIPKNVKSVATQMQNLHDKNAWEEGFVEMYKQLEPKNILAYCPKHNRYLLERNIKSFTRVVYCEPWIDIRRKFIKK